jgi:predicted O-methyltransferase YrrM
VSAPPLVARARAAASKLGLESGSRDDAGRLIHVLAARRGVTRVAEIGTGAGVGTAWIAAALMPGVPLFTVEPDPRHAAAARVLFADDPDVHVLEGDWREVLSPEAPFDAIFVDGGSAMDELDALLGLAAPGATLVLDDGSADRAARGPRRVRWLDDPRVVAIEVATGASADAIVAVVRR